MPLSDRDYVRGRHPPACTCVRCTRRRKGSWLPPLRLRHRVQNHMRRSIGRLFRAAVLMAVGAVLALALLPLFPPTMAGWVDEAQSLVLRFKQRIVAPPRLDPARLSETRAKPTVVSQTRSSTEWVSELEGQIHVLVNDERRRAALTVLTLDSKLSDVARAHSSDMAMHSFFDHDNPSGQSPSSRAANAGYKCFKDYGTYYTEGIAENIFQTWLRSSTTYMYGLPVGKDYMSVERLSRQIVDGWMDSPGHRQNIVDRNYDRQGIGVAVAIDEKVYVTQNFC